MWWVPSTFRALVCARIPHQEFPSLRIRWQKECLLDLLVTSVIYESRETSCTHVHPRLRLWSIWTLLIISQTVHGTCHVRIQTRICTRAPLCFFECQTLYSTGSYGYNSRSTVEIQCLCHHPKKYTCLTNGTVSNAIHSCRREDYCLQVWMS